MRHDRTAEMATKAALCRRLAALESQARTLSADSVAGQLEAIRGTAATHGLVAAERVCRAFSRAIGREGRAALNGDWFRALADAIGCDPANEEATADACLAAVMVRFA